MEDLASVLESGVRKSGIKEISFISAGGMGAVVAAQVLAAAAVKEGKYVYVGVANRGGSRRATPVHNAIRIADKPPVPACDVHSPTEMIVFDEALYVAGDPQIRTALEGMKSGVLMVCTHKNPEDVEFPYDFQGTVATVDAAGICLDVLRINPAPYGTTALGLYAAATKAISLDSLQGAMRERFRGRAGERNAEAARRAYQNTKIKENVTIVGKQQRQERLIRAYHPSVIGDAPSHVYRPLLPGISDGNVFIHTDYLPAVDTSKCTCRECQASWYCPEGTGIITPEGFTVDYEYCKGCGICAVECAMGAIQMRRSLDVYTGRN